MKKSSIFGIIVIAIAIAVIISTYATTSTYGTFTDARQTDGELHINGHLNKGKKLYYDALKDANHFSFYMKDQNGIVNKVVYNGTKPQDFERSEKLVLIGEMKAGTFYASKILMKCPSKYNNDLVEVKKDGQVEKYN